MPPPDIHCKQVETLYSDHHRWLRGWLCKKLGCSEQAADLVHDTFLRILNSGEVLTGLTKPRAYLTSGLVGRLEKGDLHCEQSW